jgi:hypothetical protein
MESKRSLVDKIVESAGIAPLHDLDILAFYSEIFISPVPEHSIHVLINKMYGGWPHFTLHYESLKSKIDKDDYYIVERLKELGKVQG